MLVLSISYQLVFSQELHRRNQMHQDPGKTKALQTIIEMKVRTIGNYG